MSRPSLRTHRLPQRLDYALVPAPLDMSLPFVSEKTPLPSIIVTPPSQNVPSSPDDSPFYIAFLAPPPKPPVWERLLAFFTPVQIKARTAIILLVLMFIMACHVLSHRLAACRPRLEINSGCSLVEQVAPSAFEWFDIFDFKGAATTPEAISSLTDMAS